MKNLVLSTAFLLGSLAMPSNANAKTFESVNNDFIILDDGCTMTVRGRTSDGHKFRIKGSCDEVLAILAKM